MNQVRGEAKDQGWYHEPLKNSRTNAKANADAPEIITAAPDVSSVTFLVSSDLNKEDKKEKEEDESTLMETTFGRKTSTMDHTEKMNTTAVTSAPNMAMKDGSGSEVESQEAKSWMMDSVEGSTRQDMDLEKIRKSSEAPVGRKVRIIIDKGRQRYK